MGPAEEVRVRSAQCNKPGVVVTERRPSSKLCDGSSPPSGVPCAAQALRKAAKLAGGGPTAVHAYRLLAQMKQVGGWLAA